ncbi:MAG: riboflavin synthase [Candidatus Omnitrophota bacterium]
MFAGIVEESGRVKKIERKKNLFVLTIEAKKVHLGTVIGQSIAVDGVCLTVTKKRNRFLTFDVMLETIRRTTFQYLKEGDPVNLERSLRANSRIDGHFVQGHVEGVGTIVKRVTVPNYEEFHIQIPKGLTRYVVEKGSVCVDGISLTVGEVKRNVFRIYIIPHTLKITTLGRKKASSKVNIETDILAKYILDKKVRQ